MKTNKYVLEQIPFIKNISKFSNGGLFAFYLRNVFISFGLGLIITIVGIVVYFLFHYFISYKNHLYGSCYLY